MGFAKIPHRLDTKKNAGESLDEREIGYSLGYHMRPCYSCSLSVILGSLKVSVWCGKPIAAKRDSTMYVLRKTLQRHWVATLTGLATSQTPTKVQSAIGSQDPSLSKPGTIDRSVEDVGAFIGEFAVITTGGDLNVTATATVIYNSIAGSVALAGGNGFGASVSLVTVGTVTEAFIDDDAIITVAGEVTVDASADEAVDIDAIAAAGGAVFSLGAQ